MVSDFLKDKLGATLSCLQSKFFLYFNSLICNFNIKAVKISHVRSQKRKLK